jgi:predicted amidohydrolase YtcJ
MYAEMCIEALERCSGVSRPYQDPVEPGDHGDGIDDGRSGTIRTDIVIHPHAAEPYMTEAADLLLTNARIHTLTEGSLADTPAESDAEAVAIRDGEIVRVDSAYEIEFLDGAETTVVDCEEGTVLPGFVDAHTHLEHAGQSLVHADLSAANSIDDALDRLDERAEETAGDDRSEWILGYGYDESTWDEDRYLTHDDLDTVSEDRPVAAIRVDMHTASLNSVALDRHREEMADEHVRTQGGEPNGVVVEDAVGTVEDAFEPGVQETRELVTAAIDRATSRGITGVHEKVRHSHAPRVYRELELEGQLDVRVRIDYWRQHLDAVLETGLRTNGGSELVRVGGIKTFTDGAIGGRTAKLFEPYADADVDIAGEHEAVATEHEDDGRGQWVVQPEQFRDLVDRADEAGLQVATHAIGDEAIELALSAYEDAGGDRHRIEHAELATDEQIQRMAEADVVASMQPNFHQWAGEGGLYETRLGEERTRRSNRLGTMVEHGVALGLGSDCMPMDPLLGIDHAVNARSEEQSLSVGQALRGYTRGAAYAGFDEDRLGTIEPGRLADLVVLDGSPWEHSETIRDLDVRLTIVDGDIVHDSR